MDTIRPFQAADWPTVRDIYQQGIDSKNATFERKVKSWPEWDNNMLSVCRLVALTEEAVVGWAALSAVSRRAVYAGVAEVSIYIAQAQQGRGVGKRLLSALVAESEKAGFWTLQAIIFPENQVSISLHEKCGFRQVGVRERLGKMDDRWRDVLLLERRSALVGL